MQKQGSRKKNWNKGTHEKTHNKLTQTHEGNHSRTEKDKGRKCNAQRDKENRNFKERSRKQQSKQVKIN